MERAERDAIIKALQQAKGNKVLAAAALGIARQTLYRKITVFGIETV
jgi:transcriptional regulator of acetoin/glycerol metabolism